jgi:chromosome segregation ATPase
MNNKWILLAGLALAACQTNDPSQGGFFGGVGGLTSGNYKRGVEQREVRLQDSKDQNISLTRRTDRMDAQKQDVDEQLATANKMLASIESDLVNMQQRIDKARKNKSANEETLRSLEKKLGDLNADIEQGKLAFDDPAEKKRKVRELDRKKKLVEEAIAKLAEG